VVLVFTVDGLRLMMDSLEFIGSVHGIKSAAPVGSGAALLV